MRFDMPCFANKRRYVHTSRVFPAMATMSHKFSDNSNLFSLI